MNTGNSKTVRQMKNNTTIISSYHKQQSSHYTQRHDRRIAQRVKMFGEDHVEQENKHCLLFRSWKNQVDQPSTSNCKCVSLLLDDLSAILGIKKITQNINFKVNHEAGIFMYIYARQN